MRKAVLRVALTATVVALLLMAIPLAIAVRLFYFSDEQAEIERAALRASSSIDSIATASAAVERRAAQPDIALGFYGIDGRLRAGEGPQFSAIALRPTAATGEVVQSEAGYLVTYVPVRSEEQIIGTVRAASPRSTLTRQTVLTWGAMAGLGLAAVAVAVIVAGRLSRRLSDPLVALAATAQALGDGDFSAATERCGIEEVDRAGVALDATASRLGALVQRERSFTANASHQLRTPLTALRLRLEAASDPRSTVAAHDLAREALVTADALERTIDELLRHARNPGPDLARVRPYRVDGLLEDARGRWIGQVSAAGRTLRSRVAADTPMLDCSPARVEQILDVLLENAVRHGRGHVEVEARATGNAVAFAVRDEGTGMSSEAAVFERGWSSDGGQGIGLALARQLADSLQGRLLLTKTVPSTEMTLLLPAAAIVAADGACGPAAPP